MSRNNSDTVVAPAMISVIYRDEPDGEPDLLRGRILQLDRQFREWIGPEWHEKRKDPQAAEDFKQLLGSMDTKLTGDPRYLEEKILPEVEELKDQRLAQAVRTHAQDLVPKQSRKEGDVDWCVRATKWRVMLIGKELLRLHDQTRPSAVGISRSVEISTQLGELVDKIEGLFKAMQVGCRSCSDDEDGMLELGLEVGKLLEKAESPEDALKKINLEFGL